MGGGGGGGIGDLEATWGDLGFIAAAMKKAFGLDRMTPTALLLQRCHLYSFEQRVN